MAGKFDVRRAKFVAALGVGLAVLCSQPQGGPATAAVASARQDAPQGFRSSVDLVPVYATVTTKTGTFATGLTQSDFTVLDNGVPQPIVSFAEAAQSISVFLMLDTSGRMAEARPRLFAAAREFLSHLKADDRAMVGSLVYQGPPFTSDKNRLGTSLDLLPSDPGSPLWLALDRAITALATETSRRVIIVYTDGRNEDLGQFRALKVSEASLRTRLEEAGTMLYAIGFEGRSLTTTIRTLARRSGGRATELARTDDLGRALAGVADELHHQYLLGFTPAVFDGKPHKLEVRLTRPDLLVRARELYVARRKP
jgi:VWFA-related protein